METTACRDEFTTEEIVEEREIVEEKEFGFDLSRFRYPGPQPLEIPSEEDCEVVNGHGETATELLSGNYQPVLAITREVWNEIQFLVKLAPNLEMAMFLVLKKFSAVLPKYLATDLYIPKQQVSGGGVKIDGAGMNRFYGDLNAHEDYREHMHSRLCHLHSHASMGVFWSDVDTHQQFSRDDLGFFDDSRFYVVVNARGDSKCAFVQYRPFLRRFDDLPIVIVGKEFELSDDRMAELLEMSMERTSPIKGNVDFGEIETFPMGATEKYSYTPRLDRCYKDSKSTVAYVGERRPPASDEYELEDWPEQSLANDLVYWCMEDPRQSDMFSDEDIRKMVSELDLHERGKPLARLLRKLDLDERRRFFAGYVDFVVGVPAEEMVSILPWFLLMDYSFLLRNQWQLNRLLPYLQNPLEDC